MINPYAWLIELALFIAIAGGCWIYGDVHGHNVTKTKYTTLIAKADSDRQKADNKIIQSVQTTAVTYQQAAVANQKEADDENAFSIKLQKQLAAAQAKDKLSANCVIPDSWVRSFNDSRQAK